MPSWKRLLYSMKMEFPFPGIGSGYLRGKALGLSSSFPPADLQTALKSCQEKTKYFVSFVKLAGTGGLLVESY